MRRMFALMMATMATSPNDTRQKEALLRAIRDAGILDKDEVLIYWSLSTSGSCNEIFAKDIMLQILQEKETEETKVIFNILRRITKHGPEEKLTKEADSFLNNLLEKEVPPALTELVKEKFKTI